MSATSLLMFTPARLGPLTAKNRLVHPPMVRNYADALGRATPRYVAHIERIARGGVGSIVLEASFVRQDGKGFRRQLGVHDDAMIEPLAELVAAGHQHGALMGIQLFHGGRQASASISGHQPVAPSAIPDPLVNELPRELGQADIDQLVAAFARAAYRARAAGCDFVELHGAHGYLIAQFLSPFSNRRSDAYGGDAERRRTFLVDVFQAVRAATGPDFPVAVRLSGEEALPGGLALDDTVETARHLERLGAAAVHISTGSYATYAQGEMIAPMAKPDGLLVRLAERVKAAVNIPVIAVGKLRTLALAEAVLREGKADFVALGRVLLADPDWPNKARTGRHHEIRPCIACNQGCISRLFAQDAVWCTVNPEAGRERVFTALAGGAGRKLMVVGGGPAGMAAACWAARAGFEVELFGRRGELGGQLLAAAAAPHREGWGELRQYFIDELHRLHVPVHYETEVGTARIRAAQPWAVIVATGALPIRPIADPGCALPVMTGREILENRGAHHGRAVVIGGGCSGAQTAEYLASCGHEVTLIEAGKDIALDAPVDDRQLLLGRLAERGVKLMPGTRMLGLEHCTVRVATADGERELPTDMVVVCLGARAEDTLRHWLDEAQLRSRTVGDALQPRKVTEAVAEGALAVLELLDIALEPELRAEGPDGIGRAVGTLAVPGA